METMEWLKEENGWQPHGIDGVSEKMKDKKTENRKHLSQRDQPFCFSLFYCVTFHEQAVFHFSSGQDRFLLSSSISASCGPPNRERKASQEDTCATQYTVQSCKRNIMSSIFPKPCPPLIFFLFCSFFHCLQQAATESSFPTTFHAISLVLFPDRRKSQVASRESRVLHHLPLTSSLSSCSRFLSSFIVSLISMCQDVASDSHSVSKILERETGNDVKVSEEASRQQGKIKDSLHPMKRRGERD